ALYGETTGETDEYGLPVRHDWAAEYRGRALVAYGHTPVPEPEWLNHTVNVDTGCVFGGELSALRYPEREIVSVPARRVYAEPIRLLAVPPPTRTAQQEHDDLLDYEDVSGKRRIETRLQPPITVREENAIAALEAMSRFAVDPRWLVYLPPTMSPPETSQREGLLEHPDEAFDYFRREGVRQVVCQEKHMGSRAVLVACRTPEAACRRFGIATGETGICYTRTGRRFFDKPELECGVVGRVQQAMERAGLWDSLETDWVVLDCELMPWSAKAQTLLLHQYAPVGAAGCAGTAAVRDALQAAADRGQAVQPLLAEYAARQELLEQYRTAYRHYCWDVGSLDDLRLAPFHLLATESGVHGDRDHLWHMETLAKLAGAADGVLIATPYRRVALDAPPEAADSAAAATRWWTELTVRGGEGMVVKPQEFVARGPRGLVQPAVKCRGAEYLRIIYGPEYSRAENLQRLRQRGVGAKRSLAAREFALGIEGLERFLRREPLRRVHECVFGILALESEPVDPRL
ncbi:MAG: polynucleotide kinase-phosphatase, partial [Armatimonadetes bacterium]|nr:polynucleotide kinase-phosphatase [Armatimonadota bacterium]